MMARRTVEARKYPGLSAVFHNQPILGASFADKMHGREWTVKTHQEDHLWSWALSGRKLPRAEPFGGQLLLAA
jgi:hypothetical protein